jgi:Tol biopolymer transport system component
MPSHSQAVYRASIATGGAEADWDSRHPSISADGRYIAFTSGAFNLIPGGTPDTTDVYVRDRVTLQTTCVSVSSSGARGNNNSDSPSISSDGRYVAFRSYASNLVPNDTNGVEDIFLHDTVLGTTVLVSAAAGGAPANGWSDSPAISGNGNIVAYSSKTSNIVDGTAITVRNILAWNRLSGVTTRLSKAFDGSPANGDSFFPAISEDGRYIAFESFASNILLGDTNNASDVFVADRLTGATQRVSVASGGLQSATDSDEAAISADGRWVAFRSYSTNLVTTLDQNDAPDVFLHDRATGATSLVSVGIDGAAALGESGSASLSSDGRYVAFWSRAANVVSGDTNGWDDVFVRDTVKQTTTRISAGDYWSLSPTITQNGVYVSFESYADNLVSADTNQMSDVFAAGPLAAAYSVSEAGKALRIWGGLLVADPMDLPRLNVEAANAHIDLSDATRIARKAMGLEP